MPPEVFPLDAPLPIASNADGSIPDYYGLSEFEGQTTSTLGGNALYSDVEEALLTPEPILLSSGELRTDNVFSTFAEAVNAPSENAISDSNDDEATSGDLLLFSSANAGDNPAIIGPDSASALLAVDAQTPNAEPTLEWLRQFGSVGSPSPRDIGNDVAFADNDRVIVVGEKGGDGFLAEYSLDGEQVWLAELGTDRPETIEAVAVSESSIFVAGTTGGALDGQGTGLGNDAFIAKYDLAGNLQWVNQLGTPRTDRGYGVDVDNQGNAYLTGSTRGSLPGNENGGGSDAFLAKFSDGGDLLWTQQLSLTGSQEGNDVATDNEQSVYIAGSSGSGRGFIAKFDASGQPQWDDQIDSFNYVRDLEVSNGGNLYLGGATRSVLSDAVIKKLDTDGNLVWSQELATPQNDFVESLAIGSNGTIYAVGSTRGELGDTSFGNSDLFLSSYNTGGKLNWVEQFGSPANDSANGLAIDSQGNFYLAGDTFGDLEGVSAGSSDIFVAKFGNVASGDVDLAGASFEVMQKPLVAGEKLDVEFAVDNLGSSVASAFKINFYLSEDAEITLEDEYLGDYAIDFLAGEDSTGIIGTALTLPSKEDPFWNSIRNNGNFLTGFAVSDEDNIFEGVSESGTYYFGMVIDPDSLIDESNKINNSNYGQGVDIDFSRVALEFDEENSIDLRIRTVNVNGRETRSFRVDQLPSNQRNVRISYGIENIGLAQSSGFDIDFYLSSDEILDSSDYILESRRISGLGTDSVSGDIFDIVLPSVQDPYWSGKGDGSYYVGVLIDSDDEIPETRETNNIEFREIEIFDTPQVDLVGTRILALQSASNSDEIVVDLEVGNSGPSQSGEFVVDFYLSKDSTISDSDHFLGAYVMDGVPGRSTSGLEAFNLLLPDSTNSFWNGQSNGTFYIGAVIDSRNDVKETDETDNSNNFGIRNSGYRFGDIAEININRGGLTAYYFNNIDFTGLVGRRTDPTVNFIWGADAPTAMTSPDTFSIRWTGQLEAPTTDTYTFHTISDDGVRLWIDGNLIIDNWTYHTTTEDTSTFFLEEDQKYDIRLEYMENTGDATMQLMWSAPELLRSTIPQNYLSPDPNALPIDIQTGFEYVPGELLVKFEQAVSDAQINDIAASHNAVRVERLFPKSPGEKSVLDQWRVLYFNSSENLLEVGLSLSELQTIEAIDYNYIGLDDSPPVEDVLSEPELQKYTDKQKPELDVEDGRLWNLKLIGLFDHQGTESDGFRTIPLAWDIERGSEDVVVAVLDSGIDRHHQDLKNNIWFNEDEIPNNQIDDDRNGYVDDYYGYDFANAYQDPVTLQWLNTEPIDNRGHGTRVAGVIAAEANGIGSVGVAPGVKVMALKSTNEGLAYFRSLKGSVKGIKYAVSEGARIINGSWGFYDTFWNRAGYRIADFFGFKFGGRVASLEDALEDAKDAGVLYVATAGNESKNIDDDRYIPGSFELDNIITVANVQFPGNTLAESSGTGIESVDIAAPGNPNFSTAPGNSYLMKNGGTSMAAPHVAGAAALLLSRDPFLSVQNVRDLLLDNADYVAPGLFGIRGARRLNVYNALLATNPSTALTLDVESLVDLDKMDGPFSGWGDFYADISVKYPNETSFIKEQRFSVVSQGKTAFPPWKFFETGFTERYVDLFITVRDADGFGSGGADELAEINPVPGVRGTLHLRYDLLDKLLLQPDTDKVYLPSSVDEDGNQRYVFQGDDGNDDRARITFSINSRWVS